MSVDIVIPVYNEEKALEQSIHRLVGFLKKSVKQYQWQIIIADNGSTDKTAKLAKKLSRRYQKVSTLIIKQKGRGRAVKTAWKKSRADIVSYMDVDLSTSLLHFPNLLRAIAKKKCDLAIGSRLLPMSNVYNRTLKREIISRSYNLLIKLLFRTKFSDAQCGFKAVNQKIVKRVLPLVRDDYWFFDSELLIIAEKMGYQIYEEPVKWIDDHGTTVRILSTAKGDLLGLFRLWQTKPWLKKSS